MLRTLFTALSCICFSSAALAQAPRPLDDAELGQISGGDGVGFAVHFALNDPTLPGAIKNRMTWGFNDEGGQTTYLVVDNLHGTIDMVGLAINIEKNPEGGDYVAVKLPPHLRFTNFGFDSMSAQTDAIGPVTDSVGGFSINGTLSMQGQFRMWAH